MKFILDLYKRMNAKYEAKVFNIVNAICVFSTIFICFLIGKVVEDERGLYLSFAFVVLFLLTIFEGNRTGKIQESALVMSIALNFVYIPALFFFFDRYICVVPMFFIFGIIYTEVLLEAKRANIVLVVEIIMYSLILIYAYKHFNTNISAVSMNELQIRYYAAIMVTILVGAIAGGAVRFRYLNYINAQKVETNIKEQAMDAYVAKDMFLVNMSHDVRTPMNAIVGAANLLLDQNINEQVADSLYNIINSCNALLSITDELMDISKTERGDVEIYSATYDISELLLEIINMMTVRLIESNLDFFIEINRNIPKHLYGDASKIRQILVNLLNNSLKYTEEGKIVLRVDYSQIDDSKLELVVDVEDTGTGIRREEIDKIFDIREDREDDRDFNTGISLNVCAGIVKKMNGQISVESEYLNGSTFTVKIPQKFIKLDPIATLYADKDYNILVYEKNEVYGEYIKRIFEPFDINCIVAKNEQDFERVINVNKFTHVFIANENAAKCTSFLDRRLNSEKIIAILAIDDSLEIDKAAMILNRPVNLLTVTALLRNELSSYVRDVMKKGRFTCNQANILVVDDNYTNLNVARAILEKYNASVITVASGREALKVIKDKDINLVFLDYMMPEMNGIDTLENIRKIPGSKYAALPVVALTANVISGAREMFLDAGFDEFMSKPIAIDKMERILKKFLPKDYIEYEER